MTNSVLFVQLFMGFLLRVADSSCPVTLDPPRVVVKYGDSVSINCTTNVEHKGMGWEAAESGIGLTKNVNHLTWSVKSLTNPSVEAMCFINPVSGKQCLTPADIVLYRHPETISLTSNSSDGIMEEHMDYYLLCDVQDVAPAKYLSVKWYKNEKPFNDFPGGAQNESKIIFSPTRTDQGAEFRCEAHWDLRPEGPYLNVSSQVFQVHVAFGPEICCSSIEIVEGEALGSVRTSKREVNVSVLLDGPELSCPHYLTALEHVTIHQNCIAGGYPIPSVAFYKDGEEADIEKMTRRDAGNYTLVASTETNNVTQLFELIVNYPPSQIFELENVRFKSGSTVYLKCDAKGQPRPKYSWIYLNNSNVSEKNDDGVSILEIHNATRVNIGSYKCIASNEHGEVSKTAWLTMEGVKQECPLRIKPDRMVLEYESERKRATCESTTPTESAEVYWLDNSGNDTSEWVADTRDWNASPVCEAYFAGLGTCNKKLDIILYKKPDSVSISIDGASATLREGWHTLVCEIANVAPAKSVLVRWFRGNESFTPPNPVHVSCNNSANNCNINETKESVNMWFRTEIPVNRTLNGVEFSCEAQLNLFEMEHVTFLVSKPLNITVHYKPSINTTKLSSTVPVFSGYAEDLKCEADGNPRPEIRWISDVALPLQPSDGLLSVTQKGIYICNATNIYGSDSHAVEVIEKVDYLPLIAGFVAVTVVIISIIFVFIYSIYYKNTKMRRYNLKNPKLGAHNGNVAHNGWDLPLPMTKL